MIVRVSEARVRHGRVQEFLNALTDLVSTFPERYAGLLGYDVLIDRADPNRVQFVSRWADETSLVAFAGDDWSTTPVIFPDEHRYLMRPLTLAHFDIVTGM